MPEKEEKKEVKEAEGVKSREVFIDFEGDSFESGDTRDIPTKHLLDDDVYDGVIKSVESFVGKKFDKDEKVNKLVFQVEVLGQEKEVLLPFYMTAVIRRINKPGMNNSKLFDFLVSADLLGAAKNEADKDLGCLADLVSWLGEKTKDRKCRILTQTSLKGKEGAYSTVDKIIKFEKVE